MTVEITVDESKKDRVGSAKPRFHAFRVEARFGYLVGLALALGCHYRNDPCDRHVGEEGFTRCHPCVTRDEAESIVR